MQESTDNDAFCKHGKKSFVYSSDVPFISCWIDILC